MPGAPGPASLAESVRSGLVRDPLSKSKIENSQGTTPRLSSGIYIQTHTCAYIHVNTPRRHFCNVEVTNIMT